MSAARVLVVFAIAAEISEEELEKWNREVADWQSQQGADIVVLEDVEVDEALPHLARVGIDTGELGG